MEFIKKLGRVFHWLLAVVVILVGASVVFSNLNAPGGYRLFIVQSGSMEPRIKTGSLVTVVSKPEYKEGDIVTFWENPNVKKITESVTHRIAAVEEKDGKIFFTTKGDANPAPDREKIEREAVLGKVIFSLPKVGRVLAFTKTQTGFFVLIVIPAVLIVYSELMNIKNEAKKLIVERRSRKLSALEEVEVAVGNEVGKVEKEAKKIKKEMEFDLKGSKKPKKRTTKTKKIK